MVISQTVMQAYAPRSKAEEAANNSNNAAKKPNGTRKRH
jgi:hypothetical protein